SRPGSSSWSSRRLSMKVATRPAAIIAPRAGRVAGGRQKQPFWTPDQSSRLGELSVPKAESGSRPPGISVTNPPRRQKFRLSLSGRTYDRAAPLGIPTISRGQRLARVLFSLTRSEAPVTKISLNYSLNPARRGKNSEKERQGWLDQASGK